MEEEKEETEKKEEIEDSNKTLNLSFQKDSGNKSNTLGNEATKRLVIRLVSFIKKQRLSVLSIFVCIFCQRHTKIEYFVNLCV